MQMIRAIIRPEKVDEVVDRLDNEGFTSFTRIALYSFFSPPKMTFGSCIEVEKQYFL